MRQSLLGIYLIIGLLLSYNAFAYDPVDISDSQFQQIIANLSLSQTPTPFYVASDTQTIVDSEVYHDVELVTPSSDTISISYKTPKEVSRPLPVVFMMSGYGTGRKALEMVNGIGENIVVSYDYPSPIDVTNVNFSLRRLRLVPGQVSAIVNWIHSLKIADTSRVSLLGISFGTLFLPVSQRLVVYQGFKIKTTALCFGGVNIPKILDVHLRPRLGNRITDSILKYVWNNFWDVEPMNHLPRLHGDFLIVRAEEEDVFPPESIEQEIALTPNPKEIIVLKGTHIMPDRPDLIKPFMETLMKWEREHDAIN